MRKNTESNLCIIPDAELDIMKTLWKADHALCASEIAKLLFEERGWKPATVHVLISRLIDRGYIYADRENYVHRYTPLVPEADYRRVESKSFLKRICDGSVSKMVASLVDVSDEMTGEDIAEIERILKLQKVSRKL